MRTGLLYFCMVDLKSLVEGNYYFLEDKERNIIAANCAFIHLKKIKAPNFIVDEIVVLYNINLITFNESSSLSTFNISNYKIKQIDEDVWNILIGFYQKIKQTGSINKKFLDFNIRLKNFLSTLKEDSPKTTITTGGYYYCDNSPNLSRKELLHVKNINNLLDKRIETFSFSLVEDEVRYNIFNANDSDHYNKIIVIDKRIWYDTIRYTNIKYGSSISIFIKINNLIKRLRLIP